MEAGSRAFGNSIRTRRLCGSGVSAVLRAARRRTAHLGNLVSECDIGWIRGPGYLFGVIGTDVPSRSDGGWRGGSGAVPAQAPVVFADPGLPQAAHSTRTSDPCPGADGRTTQAAQDFPHAEKGSRI